MKRVLIKKIAVAYLAAASLLFLPLEFYLSRSIKEHYISNLEKNLLIQARLIWERLPPDPTGNLDDVAERLKEQTGARVTLIDEDGRVLGDSDERSAFLENHADRPEIRDADITGSGSAIRYSKTLDKNLFYLALAREDDGRKRFLRLSVPLDSVESAIGALRLRILIASLAALSAAILVGFFLTRRMTRSIEEIVSFSKEVASGNFNRRLFLTEQNELGEIGKNIGDMAQGLSTVLRQTSEENSRMKAILANMSDGLIVTDIKGAIVMSNAAVKSIFGIASDIEGRNLTEALRNTEIASMMDTAVKEKERIAREVELTRPVDTYLIATASPYYSSVHDGEVTGSVMTFHDITRLRRLEEIRKDFVANVSHELKTPITAIKGFAETLLEGAIDEKENARKFLMTIKNHSERLNSLVSDLLTLSRIEFGDIVLERKPVRLEEVIDVVFTTLGGRLMKKAFI
jgi:two-component system, OmpR family, phosphate regulon sensor histidine kinase PhoR